MVLASFATAPTLVGLRELQPWLHGQGSPWPLTSLCRKGRECSRTWESLPQVSSLLTVTFTSFSNTVIQSNECKNPVFLWSFNPFLFFGFFPFVLLEYLKKNPLRKEVSEAYKRLKSTVDKCLSMSGYSEVNLGKLFTVNIGRSVGESNNERQ